MNEAMVFEKKLGHKMVVNSGQMQRKRLQQVKILMVNILDWHGSTLPNIRGRINRLVLTIDTCLIVGQF